MQLNKSTLNYWWYPRLLSSKIGKTVGFFFFQGGGGLYIYTYILKDFLRTKNLYAFLIIIFNNVGSDKIEDKYIDSKY